MAKQTITWNIDYIMISDSISIIIKSDEVLRNDVYINFIKNVLEEANKQTDVDCIVFDVPFETCIEIGKIQKEFSGYKFAFICNRKSMPFMSVVLDYIKLEDTWYYKFKENGTNASWATMKKLSKDDLDPMDPYYFEKFEQLKNIQ